MEKINKEALVSLMATETGFTKKDSRVALEAVISCIQGSLERGEKITLSGFGTFQVKETKARNGRNPKTGEAIAIPAGKRPSFAFSKAVKEVVKA